MKNFFRPSFIVTLAVFLVGNFSCREIEQGDVLIVGTVVGYNQMLSLGNITAAPNTAEIIVKVNSLIQGTEVSSYIIVHCEYPPDEVGWLERMTEANQSKRFVLQRLPSCDQIVRFTRVEEGTNHRENEQLSIPSFRRVNGKEEPIPEGVTLPCYRMVRVGSEKT